MSIGILCPACLEGTMTEAGRARVTLVERGEEETRHLVWKCGACQHLQLQTRPLPPDVK